MAYVIGDNCVACGTCIDECPVGAISEGDIYHINPDAHALLFAPTRQSAFLSKSSIYKG